MVKKLYSILSVLCICVGTLSAWQTVLADPSNSSELATDPLLQQAWIDDSNNPTLLSGLDTDFFVVSLFYTNCPNTCNMTLDKFSKIDRRLSDLESKAQMVLISLDPSRDSPAELAKYRQQRGLTQPNWHFLNGTEKQVADAARHLGYDFIRLDDHVFHRMKIFILDNRGEIIDTITIKTDLDKLDIPVTESQNG